MTIILKEFNIGVELLNGHAFLCSQIFRNLKIEYFHVSSCMFCSGMVFPVGLRRILFLHYPARLDSAPLLRMPLRICEFQKRG